MSEQSRVFMPQRPVVRNHNPTGATVGDPDSRIRWVDKYDLSPAERFGRLVSILPVGHGTSDPGAMMRSMEDALRDFSDWDFMLAVGDPFAIAMAVMTAARHNGGRVQLLKWNRGAGEYSPHLVMA